MCTPPCGFAFFSKHGVRGKKDELGRRQLILLFLLLPCPSTSPLLDCRPVLMRSRAINSGQDLTLEYVVADNYRHWSEKSAWEDAADRGHDMPEGLVVNALGATLVALAVVVPWIVGCVPFRGGLPREGGAQAYDGAI